MDARINLGDRVYLKIAVAGDPGCVIGFDRSGKAIVEWYDLDLGHPLVTIPICSSLTKASVYPNSASTSMK